MPSLISPLQLQHLCLMVGLIGTAVVLTLMINHDVHGQAPATPVIYKECRRPPLKMQAGRFPECGIDEAATEALRRQIEESNRELTPEEDQKVQKRIDEQYVRPQADARRQELLAVLDAARRRLAALLDSKSLRFTADEREFLSAQADWIDEQTVGFAATAVSPGDAQALRIELADRLGRVQAIVIARQREAASQLPTIENIITRIDDLVIRIGTVLRELEREGLHVPPEVTEGYLTAKIYLTDAKKTCSLRRPASCRLLRDALDEIAAMREPLCKLPSDRLTFCQR